MKQKIILSIVIIVSALVVWMLATPLLPQQSKSKIPVPPERQQMLQELEKINEEQGEPTYLEDEYLGPNTNKPLPAPEFNLNFPQND